MQAVPLDTEGKIAQAHRAWPPNSNPLPPSASSFADPSETRQQRHFRAPHQKSWSLVSVYHIDVFFTQWDNARLLLYSTAQKDAQAFSSWPSQTKISHDAMRINVSSYVTSNHV